MLDILRNSNKETHNRPELCLGWYLTLRDFFFLTVTHSINNADKILFSFSTKSFKRHV